MSKYANIYILGLPESENKSFVSYIVTIVRVGPFDEFEQDAG